MTTNSNDHFSLKTTEGQARAGVLSTRRGDVLTPVFMPVATRGAIKAGLTTDDLRATESQICLGNTYHLHLRPGEGLVAKLGGLHEFMQWDRPILTDSGGFQVFSIKNKTITDDGVWFRSHIDGAKLWIDAETSLQIQHDLGADIVMIFDECPPADASPAAVAKAVERTTAWARRSYNQHFSYWDPAQSATKRPQLFGIIQGGVHDNLRQQSLRELLALNFDGYALGGLAVGEAPLAMYETVAKWAPQLPSDKPRYLMGVGTPTDLLESIERGIDMFDCVLPTRNARHGVIYTWAGKINITNAQFREDPLPLDPESSSPLLKKYSRAYVHHLHRVGEDLGRRLLTMQNLTFYQELTQVARQQILAGTFLSWKQELLRRWSL